MVGQENTHRTELPDVYRALQPVAVHRERQPDHSRWRDEGGPLPVAELTVE